MSELNIQQDFVAENGIVLLHLAGDIDAHTYRRLEKRLEELFAAAKYRIIIDLSQLDYVSPAGLGVIVAAAQEAHLHRGKLVLLSSSTNMQRVLHFMGVAAIANVSNSFTEALAFFKEETTENGYRCSGGDTLKPSRRRI